jgi:hypothetical protein
MYGDGQMSPGWVSGQPSKQFVDVAWVQGVGYCRVDWTTSLRVELFTRKAYGSTVRFHVLWIALTFTEHSPVGTRLMLVLTHFSHFFVTHSLFHTRSVTYFSASAIRSLIFSS